MDPVKECLILSSISLGEQKNPVLAVIANASIRALKEKTHDFKSGEVADFCRRAVGAGTGAELTEILAGETSRKYGVDELVTKALEEGRIVWTRQGLAELRLNGSPSPTLLDLAIQGIAANARDASIRKLLSGILGLNNGMEEGKLQEFVKSKVGAGLWDCLSEEDGPQASIILLDRVKRLFTDVPLRDWGYANSVDSWIEGMKADVSISDLSDAAKGLRSAALIAGSLAALSGNKDLAQLSGYVQSGVQAAQAIGAVLAAGTGWGAAFAVLNLAGSLGGLQMPGLAGDNGQAERMHQEILSAIQKLAAEMRKEFAKLNDKLDRMAETLDQVLKLLKENSTRIVELKESLDVLHQKADLLQLSVNESAYLVMDPKERDLNNEYQAVIQRKGELKFKDEQQMAGALEFYSHFCETASKSPAQAEINGADVASRISFAHRIIDTHIFIGESRANSKWLATRALSFILEREYGSIPFGGTVNGPQLQFVIMSYAGAKMADGEKYKKLTKGPEGARIAQEQTEKLRDSINVFNNMMVSYRSSVVQGALSPASCLGVVLAAYENEVAALEKNNIVPLYRRVFEDRIERLLDHAADGTRQDTVDLDVFPVGDKHGLNVRVLSGDDIRGTAAAVLPLYTTRQKGADGKEITPVPLQIGIVNRGVGEDRKVEDYGLSSLVYNFGTEIRFLGKLISGYTTPVRLVFGYLRAERSEQQKNDFMELWNKYAATEPFVFLALAEGFQSVPSGKEAFRIYALQQLAQQDNIDKAKQILRETVRYEGWYERQGYLGRAFANKDYDWRDKDFVEGVQAIRSSIRKIQAATKVLAAVCRVAYEDDYPQCDVLKALLEDDVALHDEDPLALWGRTVAGGPASWAKGSPEERLARTVDRGVETDFAHDRYMHPAEFWRLRATQIRKALTILVQDGVQTGSPYWFEQACQRFYAAVGRRSAVDRRGALVPRTRLVAHTPTETHAVPKSSPKRNGSPRSTVNMKML